MLNVGVIGMGVGEKHALAYQRHSGCRLKSVCDFDIEKTQDLKIQYPDTAIYNDDQSIIEDDNIDIVSIASYDNYHYEQIIAALNNSKHVFVEKPLCLYEQEAKDIRKCLNNNSELKLSSNVVLRTCPRFIRFRDAVRLGEMGRIFYIEGDYLWGRIHKITDGWRKDMDLYSIIYGAALHMIDIIMWITDMKPIEVQAYGNKIATENTELRYNSFAAILIKFNNGLIAKITGNGCCVHPHFHGLKIFGTEQTAVHNLTGAYYLNSSDPGSEPIHISEPYPAKETRKKVIHSFVDSILDPTVTPLVTQKDVFDVMSVCFAAEDAMNTGQTVKIDYLA